MPSRTVLHVFGRMTRGGAEMRTLELMRQVDRQRFRLIFVALSGLPGELDEEIRSLGGQVFPLGLKPGFPWRFKALLRRERVSAVHSHVHLFSGFILALAASEGIPVRIAHFRNMHDGSRPTFRKKGQNAIMRFLTDRYATNILAVSEGAMCLAWNTEWGSDPRCEVIYNGLDLGPFESPSDREGVRNEFGLPPSSKICIHVGRMVEAKNHSRLISIFRWLSQDLNDCFLLLAGRGDPAREGELRDLVRRFGIEGRVLFAGQRTDVPRLLKAADLLIFPSLWEGLPGSVLESCGAGVPVLASDLPGVREIQRWLPLQAEDHLWAASAAALLQLPRDTITSVPQLFQNTPFRLELSGERLSMIWAGH